jgi:3-oxoacyl-[acyl-carrier-protein] synthase II
VVSRTVAVTGMAWDTALGNDLDGVWDQLLGGHTGVRDIDSPHELRNRRAAPIGKPLDGPGAGDRQIELAVRTVRAAMADAGLTAAISDPLLVVGTSYGAHLDDASTVGLQDWAVATGRRLSLARPPLSVSTACSSGADAILTAAQLIASGTTDVAVCGGVDILTEAKRLGHSALGTMSPTLLRSFDQGGDGTLLGEGAAILVLEEAERARRRGARAYATFLGGGSANDASGMTAPDPSGDAVLLAVQRSLTAAGLTSADIAVVNAHGSGTPTNDAVEALSFSRLFPNSDRPVVFATKGAFGHTLGATGAIEAVALIMALRQRCAPPVYGLRHIVPALRQPVPVGSAATVPDGAGLSLTLGFGGFNTSIVFGGPPHGLD